MLFDRDAERSDYLLTGSTFAFPRTGFWVMHALNILAVGYLGYKMGKNNRDLR